MSILQVDLKIPEEGSQLNIWEEKKHNFWPTWRNLHDWTIVLDNDFCGEGGIKVLIGAEMFSLTIVNKNESNLL